MNLNQINNLVDEPRLCEVLNVCRTTVYLWRKKKKIPFYKIGGQYRYLLDEVLQATRVKN